MIQTCLSVLTVLMMQQCISLSLIHILVLASGRPTAGVEPLAKELELARFGSYILSYNGGMITNCKTGEVIFSSLLPVEANKKIMGLAKEYGVDFLTYEGEELSLIHI